MQPVNPDQPVNNQTKDNAPIDELAMQNQLTGMPEGELEGDPTQDVPVVKTGVVVSVGGVIAPFDQNSVKPVVRERSRARNENTDNNDTNNSLTLKQKIALGFGAGALVAGSLGLLSRTSDGQLTDQDKAVQEISVFYR